MIIEDIGDAVDSVADILQSLPLEYDEAKEITVKKYSYNTKEYNYVKNNYIVRNIVEVVIRLEK